VTSSDGIPYLTPEIQLFYKARGLRPKDETDFAAVLPVLTEAQRHWLADALARVYGEHPWLSRTRAGTPARGQARAGGDSGGVSRSPG